MRACTPTLLLLVCLPCAAPAPAQEPPAAEPPAAGAVLDEEQWFEVRLQGAPVGWLCSRIWSYGEDGVPRRFLESAMAIRIRRLGGSFELSFRTREWCDAEDDFLRGESEIFMAENPTRQRAEREGGRVRVSSELMGRVSEKELEWGDGTLGALALATAMADLAREPEGATASFSVFDPTLGDVTVVDLTRLGAETIELAGESVATRVVQSESELMPGMPARIWFDASGRGVRIHQPLLPGLEMEMLETTREAALAAAVGSAGDSAGGSGGEFDVFAEMLATCEPRIPRPRRVDEALLRLRPKHSAFALPDLGFDARQVEESRNEQSVVLRVQRRVPSPRAAQRPLRDAPAELAEFLAPNDFLQCDDPALAAAALAAVGDETDAWTAARILEGWVFDFVGEKSMDVGLASAAETFQTRTGDCSEHAALHAALCRAAGIPARVAMGFLYFNGVLGGHAWTEVWIDGEWYALDATTGYGSVDATHLTVGTSSFDEDEESDMFGALRQVLGNLEVEVLELRYGETVVDLQAGVSSRAGADGRFADPILDLAFTLPADWRYEPAESAGASTRVGTLHDPAREARITVDVQSVPSAFDLSELPGTLARDPATGPVSLLVGGRDALLYRENGGRRHTVEVWVLDEDSLFRFRLHGPASTSPALTALLRTVDFDA